MDNSQVKLLYERLIAQHEYPGRVCPTEQRLVDFVMGSLSTMEQGRLKDHLTDCSDCQSIVDKVLEGLRWFDENKTQIFEGLVEKASITGTNPWASCPSKDELEQYIFGRIPNSSAGTLFKERMFEHIGQCKTCRETAGRIETDSTRSPVIKLTAFGQRVNENVRAAMWDMLLSIKLVAATRGAKQTVRAMPGFRAHSASSVSALVLDEDGRIVLDKDGHSRKVEFDLICAEVGSDGHIVVDLSTADQSFWANDERTFSVSAALQQENRKLILPSEKIGSDGRVTICSNLVPGIEIRVLPISAMMFAVIPGEAITRTEEDN
jgi:hypothetical protein